MSGVDNIKQNISDWTDITPVAASELAALKAEFHGIPADYLEFLEKIGHGEVGEVRIYEAPTDPSDIYPNAGGSLSGIFLFGDDFQGYCFGFDTQGKYSLVEVDPRGNPRSRSETNFLEFIATYASE